MIYKLTVTIITDGTPAANNEAAQFVDSVRADAVALHMEKPGVLSIALDQSGPGLQPEPTLDQEVERRR